MGRVGVQYVLHIKRLCPWEGVRKSTDDNMILVHPYIEEAWNTHNQSILDELLAANAINHQAPH